MRIRELLSGALVLGIGLFFAITALRTLPLGTADAMGAGYFPTVLGGILVVLGIGIALQRGDDEDRPSAPIPWRGILLIVGSVIFCGATQIGLGLVPSLIGTVLLAAFASDEMNLKTAVLLAVALSGFCAAVFKYGLSMPVALFGPWLGG